VQVFKLTSMSETLIIGIVFTLIEQILQNV